MDPYMVTLTLGVCFFTYLAIGRVCDAVIDWKATSTGYECGYDGCGICDRQDDDDRTDEYPAKG